MKFYKLISLLFMALLLGAGTSSCQPTTAVTDAPIRADRLREDFRILRKTLEKAHPGLYWYTSKETMDVYFDSTYAQLNQDMLEVEFLRRLLPVIAHIRCLHTSVSFSDKPGHQRTRVARVLPLALYPDRGRLYIEKNYSDTSHEGSQLLAINNQPINKLTDQLLRAIWPTGQPNFKEYLLASGPLSGRDCFVCWSAQAICFDGSGANGQNSSFYSTSLVTGSHQPAGRSQLLTHSPRATDLIFPKAGTALLTLLTFEVNDNDFGTV